MDEPFPLNSRVHVTAGEFTGYFGIVDKPLGEFPHPCLVGVVLDIAGMYGLFDPRGVEEVK